MQIPNNVRRFLVHIAFAALAGASLYAGEHVTSALDFSPDTEALIVIIVSAAASFFRAKVQE